MTLELKPTSRAAITRILRRHGHTTLPPVTAGEVRGTVDVSVPGGGRPGSRRAADVVQVLQDAGYWVERDGQNLTVMGRKQ